MTEGKCADDFCPIQKAPTIEQLNAQINALFDAGVRADDSRVIALQRQIAQLMGVE